MLKLPKENNSAPNHAGGRPSKIRCSQRLVPKNSSGYWATSSQFNATSGGRKR